MSWACGIDIAPWSACGQQVLQCVMYGAVQAPSWTAEYGIRSCDAESAEIPILEYLH